MTKLNIKMTHRLDHFQSVWLIYCTLSWLVSQRPQESRVAFHQIGRSPHKHEDTLQLVYFIQCLLRLLWLARGMQLLNRRLWKCKVTVHYFWGYVWLPWKLQDLMKRGERRFSVDNSIKFLLMALPLWFRNMCKTVFHTKFCCNGKWETRLISREFSWSLQWKHITHLI